MYSKRLSTWCVLPYIYFLSSSSISWWPSPNISVLNNSILDPGTWYQYQEYYTSDFITITPVAISSLAHTWIEGCSLWPSFVNPASCFSCFLGQTETRLSRTSAEDVPPRFRRSTNHKDFMTPAWNWYGPGCIHYIPSIALAEHSHPWASPTQKAKFLQFPIIILLTLHFGCTLLRLRAPNRSQKI